jgi:uncharacterized lipoprotein YbaY/heat shock protein HslJ
MKTLNFIRLVALTALLPTATTFSTPELKTAPAGGSRQDARPVGSWLDRPPSNWNRRMAGLPRPVASPDAEEVRTRCRGLVRQPSSAAERALVRAGWKPYGAVQSYGLTRVVAALSDADGMCRPLGHQAFVYWEGRYAGTLSPAAMDSRADGSLVRVRLVSPTRISAEFARYEESDPLCCPSRTSHVTYEVTRDDLPLVAPVRINTVPLDTRGGEAGAGNAPGDAARLFGRRWMLTEVDGAAVGTNKPYIEFDRAAKRASGDGGCNRFSGGFESDGTSLRVSRVISTRRACLDRETQRVETDFLRRLEQVTRFQIQGDTLRLSAGGPPLLTFSTDAGGAGGSPREARVTGTVTYLQRIALPPGAVVEVKLLDVSRSGAPSVTIAEQRIRPAGRQVPVAFELRYDPRRIEERRRYAVQARILVGGRVRYINTEAHPVITGGHPDTVKIIVRPVRR